MEAESAALTHAGPAPRRRLWRAALLLAVLLLLGWQWWRLADAQEELTRRLAESQEQARLNQEKLLAVAGKVDGLEARLAQSQSRLAGLESLSEELAQGRDERLFAVAEQAVTIAAQQLQLAGNVQAALAALQSADAGLARSGSAQFLPLRRLITRDIERLRALPLADLPGMALKLEAAITAIDSLPLAIEQRAQPVTESAAAARPVGWWHSLGRDLWSEIRGLIRVERIDSREAALLSPNQAFFLRENLKLRLVDARVALLARDGRSFREDMRQARDWLERYFDRRAKPVHSVVALINSLAATELASEAPNLNETLAALRATKRRPATGAPS